MPALTVSYEDLEKSNSLFRTKFRQNVYETLKEHDINLSEHEKDALRNMVGRIFGAIHDNGELSGLKIVNPEVSLPLKNVIEKIAQKDALKTPDEHLITLLKQDFHHLKKLNKQTIVRDKMEIIGGINLII